jgi:hypothetical protein
MQNATHGKPSLALIAGLALGALLVLVTGFAEPIARSLMVQMAPLPHDLVRLEEGSVYVVPREQTLVVKSFGSLTGYLPFDLQLVVNGNPVWGVDGMGGASARELALGVPVRAGDQVELIDGDAGVTSVALGYLSR